MGGAVMPRWLVFAPLLALVGAAAVFGLTLGWKAATTTETQVIDRIAQRYLAEHGAGAAASDCVARPARSDGLWLVVSCRPARGAGGAQRVAGPIRDRGLCGSGHRHLHRCLRRGAGSPGRAGAALTARNGGVGRSAGDGGQ